LPYDRSLIQEHPWSHSIRTWPQSGQTQVGPLESPQRFSSKHWGQIMNPQGQFQQKGTLFRQQWQVNSLPPRRLRA